MSDMQSLIDRLGITADADYADANPNMQREPGEPPMNHWLVTLARESGETMAIPFSQGLGITGPPETDTVLDCLASDASGADQPFEDWCGDYGYDTDSRRAERTYNAIVRQTADLREFMGAEFDALVFDTERL